MNAPSLRPASLFDRMVRVGFFVPMVGTLWSLALLGDEDPDLGRQRVDLLLRDRSSAAEKSENLRAAWEHFHAFSFDEAKEEFEFIAASSDAPADRIQALYGAALCHRYYYPNPDLEGARRIFSEILDEFPQSPIAPWVMGELGALCDLEDPEQRRAAREWFRSVIRDYPESLAVHEVVLRLAYTYLTFETELEDLQPGLDLLERHLQDHPDNPLAGSMHFRLDYFYYSCLQDYARSQPHAVRLGELRMEDPFRQSSHNWHVAMVFIRQGKPNSAIPWLERLLEETPRAREAYSAKLLLERILDRNEN